MKYIKKKEFVVEKKFTEITKKSSVICINVEWIALALAKGPVYIISSSFFFFIKNTQKIKKN